MPATDLVAVIFATLCLNFVHNHYDSRCKVDSNRHPTTFVNTGPRGIAERPHDVVEIYRRLWPAAAARVTRDAHALVHARADHAQA